MDYLNVEPLNFEMGVRLRSREKLSWLMDAELKDSLEVIFSAFSGIVGCISVKTSLGQVLNFDWSCQDIKFFNDEGHLVIDYVLSELDEFNEGDFFLTGYVPEFRYLRRYLTKLGVEVPLYLHDNNTNFCHMLHLLRKFYLTPEKITACKIDGFYINYNIPESEVELNGVYHELSDTLIDRIEKEVPSFTIVKASWSVCGEEEQFPESTLSEFNKTINNNRFYVRSLTEVDPDFNLAF